jgi:DNA invertase Pin-like site-specific DNA recombinase
VSKITVDHLQRIACVYVRQSTPDQLVHNLESQRRQYGLADRAKQLGWTTVEIIDDDLGRSGGGIARPGFERLLAAICDRRVGAVLAIEASRLARNGRDWHTLIEFCGLVGTILVDEDGIYDPRHPNDRLLLGMKGTMSELELSLFRQASWNGCCRCCFGSRSYGEAKTSIKSVSQKSATRSKDCSRPLGHWRRLGLWSVS